MPSSKQTITLWVFDDPETGESSIRIRGQNHYYKAYLKTDSDGATLLNIREPDPYTPEQDIVLQKSFGERFS